MSKGMSGLHKVTFEARDKCDSTALAVVHRENQVSIVICTG